MLLAPADIIGHAHGGDDFGIAQTAIYLGTDLVGLTIRILHFLAGDFLVGIGQQHHDNTGKDRCYPKPGVKHKHHCHINGEPGGVEKRKQAAAGEKLPQAGKIAQRLRITDHATGEQGALESSVGYPLPQIFLDAITGADQNHRAHPFKTTHGHQQSHHQQRQAGQCRQTATGNHPIKHLQHIDDRHQHQHVHRRTEDAGINEIAFNVL